MHSKKITTDRFIDPKKLSPEALGKLCDELYHVHSHIFDGVNRDAFLNYVLAPDNYLTRLFIFRNASREVVGYLTFQVFEFREKRNGRRSRGFLYRTETGLLRAYRGRAPIFQILVKEIWKFVLRHGLPNGYFVATPIHPVPYVIAERSIAEMYPRPETALSQKNLDTLKNIARILRIDPQTGGPDDIFLAKVGWKVRSNQSHKQKVECSKVPACRFYLDNNPGYTEGQGMLLVAPATLRNGFKTAIRSLRRRRKRIPGRVLAKAIALPFSAMQLK